MEITMSRICGSRNMGNGGKCYYGLFFFCKADVTGRHISEEEQGFLIITIDLPKESYRG